MKTRGLVFEAETLVTVGATQPAPDAATLYDRSRFRNHGTITGATWVRLPSGLWVLSYSGINNYITLPNAVSVRGQTRVSFECWFNTAALTGVARTIYAETISTSDSTRFTLLIATTNLLLFGGRAPDTDGFTTWVASAKALTINTWYHVMVVFNSVTDVHSLILNGVAETGAVAEPAFDNTAPFTNPRIGVQGSGLINDFSGMIALEHLYFRDASALAYAHFQKDKTWFGVS